MEILALLVIHRLTVVHFPVQNCSSVLTKTQLKTLRIQNSIQTVYPFGTGISDYKAPPNPRGCCCPEFTDPRQSHR